MAPTPNNKKTDLSDVKAKARFYFMQKLNHYKETHSHEDFGLVIDEIVDFASTTAEADIRKDEREKCQKEAYLASCSGCKEGHPSFWKTIVESDEWEAWEKEQRKRIENIHAEEHKPVFDVDESREINAFSPKHWKEFVKFIRSNLHQK